MRILADIVSVQLFSYQKFVCVPYVAEYLVRVPPLIQVVYKYRNHSL